MKHAFTSATCKNCLTLFTNVPLDGDEDGSVWAALEIRACADCGQELCRNCEQFACDGCGDTFCLSHRVEVPDGTPRPLACCAACAAECAVEDAEPVEPIPAARETRALCPDCGSVELEAYEHQAARCAETGYDESGAMFRCRDCGARGPAEDVILEPVAVRIDAERERGGTRRSEVA